MLQKQMYINANYNDYHQRKTRCTFLYLQKGKNSETFIYEYKNTDTSQNVRQFALRFYLQKFRHFTLRNFSQKKLKLAFIYKNMILCVT